MSKYTIVTKFHLVLNQQVSILCRDGLGIAIFLTPNHKTDAQKVCDLLNETSRSQGVYPK